jgi:hypothetical protein
MTRALSSSWRCVASCLTALFLIALASSTAFAGKPTVAILGLEVVDPNGNIDQVSTQVARDLTEGLRNRAKAGVGPYQLAAGSEKELIDEKLIHNCDNEAISCMVEIGKNIGADYLIYGRLEKRTDGYQVTINLLNINKRKFEKAKTPLMITKRDPASLAAAGRKAYNDLVGVSDLGTLVVTANVDRGTVLLDDEPRGTLMSGTATISGLKENRYRLAVEADGYQRSSEVTVTIRSGETTKQSVSLAAAGKDPTDLERKLKHEITGTTSTASSFNPWKPVFYASLAAGVGLAGASAYFWDRSRGYEITAKDRIDDGASLCDGSTANLRRALEERVSDLEALNAACSDNVWHKRTFIAASIVGVIVLGSGYMAYFRGGSDTPPSGAETIGRRAPKKRFSVTPVVSTEGGGATFQIDW